MAIRATPEELEYYSHMFSLSDGVTTIGLNAVNRNGAPDIKAVQRQPYPRSTLAVGNASGQLSERRAPFGEFSRSDWSGGMGMEDGEAAANRYWHGRHVFTHVPGKVMLAPMTYYSMVKSATNNYPGQFSNRINLDTVYTDLGTTAIDGGGTGTTGYSRYAIKLSVPADTIIGGGTIWDERSEMDDPSGYNLYFWIETDNAGSPSGTKATVDDGWNYGTRRIGSRDHNFYWTPVTLSAGDYWFVIAAVAGRYEFRTLPNSSYTAKRYNGTAWSDATGIPLFELITSAEWADAKFFTYKDQQYLATRSAVFDTSRTADSLQVFMNGYRGSADSNSGNLDYLIDATQTFEDIKGNNGVMRAYESSNAGDYTWRIVESALIAHQLKATLAWPSAHSATTTEYVVERTMTWRELTGHGATKFRDIAVTDNGVVYAAQGETVNMRRWREYNNGGTWTLDAAADGTNKADLLLPAYDQKLGHVLWRARNTSTRRQVSQAPAQDWGTDLTFGTEVGVGGRDEKITGLIIYDGKLAVLQSGSVWMVLNGVPDKLSVNLASKTPTNGRNPEIVPPYLILPYANGIERLYNNLLEDFGPERDSGLPADFGGVATDTETIPGGILMCKDGGQSMLDLGPAWHVGTVLLYRGGGWHPIMEMPFKHHPLALTVRRFEDNRDMLWCATKRGVSGMYWPREWDYTRFTDQVNHYEPHGYLITGWFDCGSVTLDKWWDRITIHADGLGTTNRIEIYYQTSEDGKRGYRPDDIRSWTYAGTTSGSDTRQSINLNVTSKKIRFFIHLVGDYNSTPIMLGYNVEYLARVQSASAYPLNIRVSDMGVDREGQAETLDTAGMIAQLDAWAETITPLTMRSILESYDNKLVLIERPGLRPLWLDAPMGQESEFASLSIIEVKDAA